MDYVPLETSTQTIARLRSSLDKAHERETKKKALIRTLEAKLAEQDAEVERLKRLCEALDRMQATLTPEEETHG